MASSSTQIANIALAYLGQQRITSLSDDNAAARNANEFYATARDFVTAAYMWRHALTIAALVETTNDRSDDFDYAYTRPSGCLSFRYVLPEQGPFDPKDPVRFEALGEKIYTDESDARAFYVAQSTDVTKYPPSFTDAIAWYLAHLMVGPLRQENRLLEVTANGFRRAIEHAIAMGDIEKALSDVRTADEAAPDWIRGR